MRQHDGALRAPRPWFPRPIWAGVVGCLSFFLIGWTALLIPSLIRSVEATFNQSDAGIGFLYLLSSAFWAGGSFGGGFLVERFGRRTVLSASGGLLAVGLLAFGLAPSWVVFLLAAIPAGLGAGAIDSGANGLFLDLFPAIRGRALNGLHLFFSLGALADPLTIGPLVEGGVGWQAILVVTGVVVIPIAVAFATVPMPGGRRKPAANEAGMAGAGTRDSADAGTAVAMGRGEQSALLTIPLALLAFGISCYVAAEVGISNWLVRFLEPAPLSVATTALSLYWAGLAVGRLVSSQLADRFDHRQFAIACATGLAVALIGAIFVPILPISIALFALAGLASGPIFPMIVAIGGERFPDRSAAVSGLLGGSAVVGSIVYPPVMGFLSITVGLIVAMAGIAVLGLACAGALVAFVRFGRG